MAAPSWFSETVSAPPSYVSAGGLKVHPSLAAAIKDVVCEGTGFSPAYFWSCLEQVTQELRPELERCLRQRDELQVSIDGFYQKQREDGKDPAEPGFRDVCKQHLKDCGYLLPLKGPVNVNTQFVDPEIAEIPAPQLVVPSDNARYVVNAVNARWTSLFDALYGFDLISKTAVTSPGSEAGGGSPSGSYDPERGNKVIHFATALLDESVPLASGQWDDVARLWPKVVGSTQQLEVLLRSGATTILKTPTHFVGSTGTLGPPTDAAGRAPQLRAGAPSIPDVGRIFLKHHGLHMILEIDHGDSIGKTSPGGIKDVTLESALTVILDMEDSVAAVDAEDKVRVYSNVCGVLRGTLQDTFAKGGRTVTRNMRPNIWLRDAMGRAKTLPGRALSLVRNVGHHMFSDMVITSDGKRIPEGFVDCLVTAAAALRDLRGTGRLYNSRTGSVYIVKPKMHGPDEVALTSQLFSRAEEFFGLRLHTIKLGMMDEERRTSSNLQECMRAAAERIFFINTGFLDRTGDEIHTAMMAGPVVRKADMRQQKWIKTYEKSNVDIGIAAGLPGKGQIGKGMWARPDSMKAMFDSKIEELMAGASTAWVPSPSAAALHSLHYHRVDVRSRQMELAMRSQGQVDNLLEPPLIEGKLNPSEIRHELRENAQSILGYVVRWIDLGIGCSKVPDLSNVGLMEDRATLRISSQLLANWLQHGLISEKELRETFAEMAKIVDQQNAREREYRPMSKDPESNVAFQASLKLVLDGAKAPNGYTEFTLHEARRKVKEVLPARL